MILGQDATKSFLYKETVGQVVFLHTGRTFVSNMPLYSCDSMPRHADLFHLHSPGEWVILLHN